MGRLIIYIVAGALALSGWLAAYAMQQQADRLEEKAANLSDALEGSEKRGKRLANEIKTTGELLAAVRRDRAEIDARFDRLSGQLQEAIRDATDAQRACLALEHGDAIGRVLRGNTGDDDRD